MRRDQQFVDMTHPATGITAIAQIDAYEQVWKEKGWTLVGGDPTDLENETKARLLEIAAERGIEVAAGATKAEVLDALKGEGS